MINRPQQSPSEVIFRSQYLLPTTKETPAEAQTTSHRLMLRAGMIRQATAGIYSWLPLGLRVLRKVEAIVRSEMDRAGGVEILLPTLQSADLWHHSGRYDSFGKEMLRVTDRNGRELIYGPTNEEQVSELFAAYCKSYKDVPKILYQCQLKFRDEIRPRFGVMRGREFLMKDGYSFDLDQAGALRSYRKMFMAYLRIFHRLGLRPIPMRADTGPIGGDTSHEFVILAKTGESAVFCHREITQLDPAVPDYTYDDNLDTLIAEWTRHYAATEDVHDAAKFAASVNPADQVTARGIEVGHIFYFGDLYSKPFNLFLNTPDGKRHAAHMGSYGVGISRLAAAIIEANHDQKGIIWPTAISPFDLGIVNLGESNADCRQLAEQCITNLQACGCSLLVDDRNERPGVKLAEMELIGLPYRVTIGPKYAGEQLLELYCRADDKTRIVTVDSLTEQLRL